jgi:uncharacterized glyoxalase superfamily protein PhnB
MRFNGSCIITDDVISLANFYDLVLGTTSDINEVHTNIHIEGAGLAIYDRNCAKEDMNLSFHDAGSNIVLQFIVEDVDKLFDRLSKLEIDIINEPVTYPWGAKSMQIKDLDGNIITFASMVE